MLGIGAGHVVAAALAPKARRGEWLTSGAIVAVLGPIGLYLSYDVGALGRWPAWALSLLALAGWELFWGVGPGSAREATAAWEPGEPRCAFTKMVAEDQSQARCNQTGRRGVSST